MSTSVTLARIPGFTPEWTFTADQLIRDPAYPQTDELCLDAVTIDGDLLKYVKNQTESICLAAVKDSYRALKYCTIFSQEICDIAVSKNPNALKYVPGIYQTRELCIAAVRQGGMSIEYVKNQTPELVQIA